MKTRSIAKMFLLELVTFGIYRLYYLIKTRREMMDSNPTIKIMSPVYLLIPLAIFLIGFVALIASAASSPRSSSNCSTSTSYSSIQQATSSYTPESSGCTTQLSKGATAAAFVGIGVFYLAFFVGFVLLVVWEWSYAHGVETITSGQLSFALGLIILILVPDGIDILIVQDYFNKISSRITPANPLTMPPQPPQAPSMPTSAA